jgi:hypothetical protein
MGKKRKQDRRRQGTPGGAAPPFPARQPRKPLIPSSRRNPVTGEPLTRNTPYIVVRNYAKPRFVSEHGQTEKRLDCIPAAIHRLREDTIEHKCAHDGLGAPSWTKEFRRYIREHEALRPRADIELEYLWNHWYAPEWAESELRAAFPSPHVDAMFAVKRDGANWHHVATALGHSISWLDRKIEKMATHIRAIILAERCVHAS